MFQRIFRQVISSKQCIANFPYIVDIKHFRPSIIYFKAESNNKNSGPFEIYSRKMYPILKEEHPNLRNNQIVQAVSQEWQQLSKKEKDKYRNLFQDEMDAWRADNDTIEEIEKLKNEIAELVHDRPTRYSSLSNFYFADVASKSNGKEDAASLSKIAKKEWNSINENLRSVYQKKFEQTQLEFENWKQKVEKDDRAEVIKNVKFILSKRLKSLEFDKPKKALPYNYFLQQNIKSCESEKQREKLKELGNKWQNLSAAEKEPYYEPISRYRNELSVWKLKTKQDGRYKNIEAVKKLLRQLKM